MRQERVLLKGEGTVLLYDHLCKDISSMHDRYILSLESPEESVRYLLEMLDSTNQRHLDLVSQFREKTRKSNGAKKEFVEAGKAYLKKASQAEEYVSGNKGSAKKVIVIQKPN